MSYLDTWRSQLPDTFKLFAPLLNEDLTLSVQYGISAGALLWCVREMDENKVIEQTLIDLCGGQALPHLRRAVGGWDIETPLTAARSLTKRANSTPELKSALDKLLLTFLDEFLKAGMLQPRQSIDISGSISGANIVIGGMQVVAGDLIIQTKPNIRTCPTAPNPPKHFTGRTRELTQLRGQLTGEGVVAITAVKAMGGMGKTSLAQFLAHQPDLPFGAVLWAEIRENPSVSAILTQWASYASSDYTLPSGIPLEQIADHVRAMLTDLITDMCGGQTLVVFDDVWESSVEAVRLLQRAMPSGSQVLVTTRQEQVVQALQGRILPLDELPPGDAKTLLKKLITHPKVTDEHINRVVSLLNGHPLALELAAASLNLAEDDAHIGQIIQDYAKGIDKGSPFDALDIQMDRPRSLNVVFERSYEALADTRLPGIDLKAYFRALGVIATDAVWNRPLAGAVWNTEEENIQRDIHQALRTRAFITHDTTAGEQYGGTWYRLHPLLRAYARALLLAQGEHDLCFTRYTEYVSKSAQSFKTLKFEEWSILNPLLPHIDEVGDRLIDIFNSSASTLDESRQTQITDFVESITGYVFYRPHTRVFNNETVIAGLNWLEMGMALARQRQDALTEAAIAGNIGIILHQAGDTEKAAGYLERAKQLMDAMGDDIDNRTKGTILNNLGLVVSQSGDNEKAMSYFEQALALYQSARYEHGITTALNAIGGMWVVMNNPSKSLEYFTQSRALSQTNNDKLGEAYALQNMGSAVSRLQGPEDALTYFEQAVRLYQQIGDQRGEAYTLDKIGDEKSKLGEKSTALEMTEQALALFRYTGDYKGQASALKQLSEIYSDLKDFGKGLAYAEQALPLYRRTHDQEGEASALYLTGRNWSDLKGYEQALSFLTEAAALAQSVGDSTGRAYSLHEMGKIWSEMGEPEKALEYLNQALILRKAAGDKGGQATTLHYTGNAWEKLKNHQKALQFYEEALELCRQAGDQPGEAATLDGIGRIWIALHNPQKALHSHEEALELHRKLKNEGGEATVLGNLGSAWQLMGDTEKSLHFYTLALALVRKVHDTYHEAVTLDNMGVLWVTREDHHKAIECFEASLKLHRAMGNTRSEEVTEYLLAKSYADIHNHRMALTYYEKLLEENAARDMISRGDLYFHIGTLQTALGNAQKALQSLEKASETYHEDGNLTGEAAMLAIKATIWSESGEINQAIAAYEKSIHILQGLNDQKGLATLYYKLSSLYYHEDNIERAIEYLEKNIKAETESGETPQNLQLLERLRHERDEVSTNEEDADDASGSATLPLDFVQMLAGNTFAVKTSMPEKLNEWKSTLQKYRDDFLEQGDDWLMEVAFADALLNMLDDKPAPLPEHNPYAPYLRQLMEAIKRHHQPEPESPSSTIPLEEIQTIMNSTLVAKTNQPETLEEWRTTLQRMQTFFESRGSGWSIEAALTGALMNVLNDQPASLPDDNPYALYLQQVVESIKAYKA